jgi:hypothetical protein
VINNKAPHQAQGTAYKSATAADTNTEAADRLIEATNKNTAIADKNEKAANKKASDKDKNAKDTRRSAEITSKKVEAENKITREEADARDDNTKAPAYDNKSRFSGDTTKADITQQAGEKMEGANWLELGLTTDAMVRHGSAAEETPPAEKNGGTNNTAIADKNEKAADKKAADKDKNAKDTRRSAEITSRRAEAENKITREKVDARDANTEAPAYDNRGRFSGDTTKADITK